MTSTLMLLLPLSGAVAHGATLSGTLRRSSDDQPVVGAYIVAYDARLSYTYTVTGQDGSWTLSDVEAGRWRLRALPPESDNLIGRYYPAERDYCSGQIIEVGLDSVVEDLDMDLGEGGILSGRLLDSLGQPVANASVTALGASTAVEGHSRSATSDVDGLFRILGLDLVPGQATDWSVGVSADGWPTQYLGSTPTYLADEAPTWEVTAGDGRDLGDVVLLDGIGLTGEVRGPDGPVPQATVYAYSSGQIQTLQTDDAGVYQALGLPPGNALVWAQADGIATTYYPDVDRPTETVEALEEGQFIQGVDLDAPAEARLLLDFGESGAGVRAMVYNSTYTVGKGSAADDDGLLTISGLFGAEYTVFAWGYPADRVSEWLFADDQGEPTPITVPASLDHRVEVELDAGARLSGTLTDDSGQPVYGAAVYLTPVGGDTWSAVSDREGNWTIGGLREGAWLLDTRLGDYCLEDPGYVPLVWPGEPNPMRAQVLHLEAGEHREGMDLTVPRDDDHDGMGDRWEDEHGLDPSADDSDLDPDGDGILNLDEYLLGSDPMAGPGCGCASTRPGIAAWGALPLALLGLRRRRRR